MPSSNTVPLGVILIALIIISDTNYCCHGNYQWIDRVCKYCWCNSKYSPSSQSFYDYQIFISWLNLDFGINGICFYHGMNQLQYAAWQIVFPIYLWLLVGGINVVICCYSVRMSKFFGNKDPVAVHKLLASIILLMYNTFAQNIIATSCPLYEM